MQLAVLGTGQEATDISQYINYTTYKVDSEPVYNEWIDANYTTHRDEVRRRIKGSFQLAFVTDTDYNAFLTLLNNNKSGNLLRIKVYVGSDINSMQDIICHYSLKTDSRKEANDSYIVTLLTMSIEER